MLAVTASLLRLAMVMKPLPADCAAEDAALVALAVDDDVLPVEDVVLAGAPFVPPEGSPTFPATASTTPAWVASSLVWVTPSWALSTATWAPLTVSWKP